MLIAGLQLAMACGAHAQQAPEASNMRLVGMNDLQARSAYQPTIHHQGDRWIAYIGHHGGTDEVPDPVNPLTGKAEPNGTSIIDVTDPAHPKYLHHIPGQEGKYEGGGAQMVRVCDGKSLPHGDKGGRSGRRLHAADLRQRGARDLESSPISAKPVLVTASRRSQGHPQELVGMRHRHRLPRFRASPDWRTRRMTQVYDLSDPAHPVKIRDFGLPGQEPGSTGTVPTEVHGPISTGPKGNRVFFGYGTDKGGVLQIVDREKLLKGPAAPTPDNLRAPEIAQLAMSSWNGAHTTFPMLQMPIAEFAKDKDGSRRDIVMIVDEAILNECAEARQMVWFADVSIEKRPMMISSWTVPEASGNFCERGGRFGSHSSNESMDPVYYGKMAFIAFFNAGVRALDIRDPYHPTEVGYYIPAVTAATDKRCIKVDGKDRCKTAIQTNNVETDARGYVYIVDRANTGLHILELTGSAHGGGIAVSLTEEISLAEPPSASSSTAVDWLRDARRGARDGIRSPGLSRAMPGPPGGRGAVRWDRGLCAARSSACCGNCGAGVVADEEVDGVTGLDLLDEHFVPLQSGGRIRITDLFGRARCLAEGIAVSYKFEVARRLVDDKAASSSSKVASGVNAQLGPRRSEPPQLFSRPSRTNPHRIVVRCSIGRSTSRSMASQTMPMVSMPTTMRADWKYCWALKIA